MTAAVTPPARTAELRADRTAPADRPPGDRYYRHPGDVVRLVVWATTSVVLLLAIELAADTTEGLTSDLGRAAGRVPRPVREISLALVQVSLISVAAVVLIALAARRRWRRIGILVLGASVGAAAVWAVGAVVDLDVPVAGALSGDGWLAASNFPNLPCLAGLAAAEMIGKLWLSRSWRRAADLSVVGVAATMAVVGSAGVPQTLFAAAVGMAAGAGVLVVLGAPNRRPSPAAVAGALRDGGLAVRQLDLQRAEGGRSQLYSTVTEDGRPLFMKVYGEDSRDADLLYRGYRTLLLRGEGEDWPSMSLRHDVEHEALLLLLAARAGVSTAELVKVTPVADGSMVLVTELVDGVRLDQLEPTRIEPLLDPVWREVRALHDAGLAHRSLRMANILIADGRPVVIDLGFGEESATPRLRAIDVAELMVSLASVVPAADVVASAERCLGRDALVASMPYLQPLALSRSTRKQVPKSLLDELRGLLEETTGEASVPLERLVRVRPRTVVMVVTFTAAFYVLLPQLANVDQSVRAMEGANWGWLAICVVMSLVTYLLSAVALAGSVPDPLPAGPTVEAQLASSFVNRVTPANVGGMALNVRYMQKVGVAPATAVTGMGLNAIAGGIVHVLLLIVFVAFSRRGSGGGFHVPASSKVLVVIAAVLVIIGLVAATARGRRLLRTHVFEALKRAGGDIASLGRSPIRLVELFGGSAGVTLAYITALAAAVAAFHGDVGYVEIGAVYLGASIVSAAAPTPGGLGAMEAALIAGLTGIGVASGTAVAAVLGYRLATFWLPILPGWLSLRRLERHNII